MDKGMPGFTNPPSHSVLSNSLPSSFNANNIDINIKHQTSNININIIIIADLDDHAVSKSEIIRIASCWGCQKYGRKEFSCSVSFVVSHIENDAVETPSPRMGREMNTDFRSFYSFSFFSFPFGCQSLVRKVPDYGLETSI